MLLLALGGRQLSAGDKPSTCRYAARVSDSPRDRVCPECGTTSPSELDAKFCHRCGQELEVPRLRLREILSQAIDSLVSLELPILRTLRDLSWRLGSVARQWIAGRRRRYVNPIKFSVIVGVLIAFTYEPLSELRSAHATSGRALYQVGLAHYSPQYFAFLWIPLLVPLAVALRAFAAWLGVRRRWLEWYVLGLYAYSFAALLQLVLSLVGLVLPGGAAQSLLFVEFFLPIALLLVGSVGFVGAGERLRAAAASVLAQAAVLIVGALVFGWFAG